MKGYVRGFSLDLEEAMNAVNRPQNMRDYVPEGQYHAFVIDAYSAPNSRRDGYNLVVDFSIHSPGGLYDRWIVRKYMSITKPGYQIQMVVSASEGSLSNLIGTVWKITMKRDIQLGGKIGSSVDGIAPFNFAPPEHISQLVDTLYDFIDPTEKSVYKRELSVDFYKRVAKSWSENSEQELEPKEYHECNKKWLLTHVLGHNCVQMAPRSASWIAIRYTTWNPDAFGNYVLIESEVGNYALVRGIKRGEAEKICKANKLRAPLPSSTPVPVPFFGYNLDRIRFDKSQAGESVQDQINFVKDGVVRKWQ